MSVLTLGQIADLVHGRACGDLTLRISGADTLEHAGAGQICFVEHAKAHHRIEQCLASAVLIPEDMADVTRPAVRVPVGEVRGAFAKVVRHFRSPLAHTSIGISPLAAIDSSAEIADDAQVHPYAVIGPEVRIGARAVIHPHVCLMGRCRIGEDVTIFPGAVLYEHTEVGDRCVIHASAVLGAYGFGYDTVRGTHHRGDQLGYVILEEDVEVGAGTTIDRGTYGPTVIGQGTKIDNLVMIAHNCRIGRHNLICSQVGIAGSSTTGDHVIMAGQVGVPDHVRIGHRAVLGAKSGIMRDVPDDQTVIGIPATPERDQMAKQAAFAKLPEMRKQLRQLQKLVDQLAAAAVPEAHRQDAA